MGRVTAIPQLSVAFILAPRFTLNSFANFVDVLRLAGDEGDRSRPIKCRWHIVSATLDPIKSSCGVIIQPDTRLDDPSQYDYIAVVGGLIDQIDGLGREYLDYLHYASNLGIPLIGICTGSFYLSKAGLMGGYRVCVSWFHRRDFLEKFEGMAPVSDQIFVVDGSRLSCSGGFSAAHLAAYLVELHVGVSEARKSLNIMIIDDRFEGDKAQPTIPLGMNISDNVVQRALAIMQQEGGNFSDITTLAERIGVSRRLLEKRFQESCGKSPSEMLTYIRVEKAKSLIISTDMKMTDIAIRLGFCDASHFGKVFKKQAGTTPKMFQAQNKNTKTSI